MKDFERIKELRRHLNLSQTDFALKIGVSRGVISNIEAGLVEIKDYVLKLICSVFGANEKWILTGDGEMFTKSKDTVLDELKNQFNLDNIDMAIFEGYLSLDIAEREAVKKYIFDIAERVTNGKAPTDRNEEIIRRINDKDKMIAEEQKSNINK